MLLELPGLRPELGLNLLLGGRGQGPDRSLSGFSGLRVSLDFVQEPGKEGCLCFERRWSLPNVSSDRSLRFVRFLCWQPSSWSSDSATALMRRCLRSEKGRVVLRLLHRQRGVDLSFVAVSGFFFVTTERTVDVVIVFLEVGKDVVKIEVLVVAGGVGVRFVGVIEVTVADYVVKWTNVRSWLLTDASFWVRRIFIRISV